VRRRVNIKGKMSTTPYSLDLRKKVIKYIEQGNSNKEASKVFDLHRNTISRWWNRYKKEGMYCARKRLGAKRTFDLKELELLVKNTPDIKLSEIANHFKISIGWSSMCLKTLGFSYKKKPFPMWKQAKKRENNIQKP